MRVMVYYFLFSANLNNLEDIQLQVVYITSLIHKVFYRKGSKSRNLFGVGLIETLSALIISGHGHGFSLCGVGQ